MWTRRLRGLGARLVGVVTVLLVPAVTVPAAALFTPVAPPPAIPAAALALRSRVVTMDLGQVQAARVEQTAPTFSGGYSVAGRIVGEPLGTLTLVVNGETVVGTVRLPGETYRIRSMGDGLYTISEVDEPPLTCGVEGPHAETAHPY